MNEGTPVRILNVFPYSGMTGEVTTGGHRSVEVKLDGRKPTMPHYVYFRLNEVEELDPFSDEALGQRTPEAIAQDDRQAADFGGHDPQYHAALVVICEEQGAGRYARAINLVAKIWGKHPDQVLRDAVML